MAQQKVSDNCSKKSLVFRQPEVDFQKVTSGFLHKDRVSDLNSRYDWSTTTPLD